MRHQTGSFNGVDQTTIFTQHWLPDSAPHAIVIIVHGLGEHSARYAHVATQFAQHGYGVYVLDHRGHGCSEGDRVQVANFEDTYVADLRTFVDAIQAAHPDLLLFLYGHSMGAPIALLFALRYQDELTGLITTGTALKFAGINAVTASLLKTMGKVLPHARLIGVDPNGVSRDPAVVKAYIDDPLVHHGRVPLMTLIAMQAAADQCIQHLPDLHLPYLALHGSEDTLILAQSAQIVRERAGSPDTTVNIYDGLHHEVHNEPEQDQVIKDMLDWLGKHAPPA